jgi:hypothetical protein
MSFIQWNAKLRLDGANPKYIGLGWGTEDVRPGGIRSYEATITVEAPPQANPTIVAAKPNEKVTVTLNNSLYCGPKGVDFRVTYRVKPGTGQAKTVIFCISKHAGQAKAPDGLLEGGFGTGPVNANITTPLLRAPA